MIKPLLITIDAEQEVCGNCVHRIYRPEVLMMGSIEETMHYGGIPELNCHIDDNGNVIVYEKIPYCLLFSTDLSDFDRAKDCLESEKEYLEVTRDNE